LSYTPTSFSWSRAGLSGFFLRKGRERAFARSRPLSALRSAFSPPSHDPERFSPKVNGGPQVLLNNVKKRSPVARARIALPCEIGGKHEKKKAENIQFRTKINNNKVILKKLKTIEQK